MKVLMVNGSSNMDGCTYTALCEIGNVLEENNVEYEIFQLGKQPIRDCMGCNKCQGKGCIFQENGVNDFIEKARHADGFVFGSPVYFAHPSGRILSFLDRVFYACSENHVYTPFVGKPGAAIVSARRGGTTASIDVLNKYFTIASMPVIASTYWNMVHGETPEEVRQDLEGLQTMRNIGRNMAWMLRAIEVSRGQGIAAPVQEVGSRTDFIR